MAGALAMMTGKICVIVGLAKTGFLTELISKPIRYEYMNGIALTVIASHLPPFCAFSVTVKDFPQELIAFGNGVILGQVNLAALSISLLCKIVILGCKYWAPRIPGVLIAIVVATIAVTFLQPLANAHLSVVRTLPQGLPGLQLAIVSLADLHAMLTGVIAIALAAFADHSVLSRIYAQRGGGAVNSNRELVSLGIAHVATGLFQGFSVSVSA